MRIKRIVYFFLIFSVISCGENTNQQAIEKGEAVLAKYKHRLSDIRPICDSIFRDTCNVFYILTSPTTDLFAQGAWLENYYYEGCMLPVTQSQKTLFQNLMVQPDLTDVYYLKNIYIAFGISYLNHGEEGIKLVKILDKVKFDKLFQFSILRNKTQTLPSYDWLYRYKDDWYIVSGNLVRTPC